MDQEKMKLISELEVTMRMFIRDFRKEMNEQLGDGFTSSDVAFLRIINESSNQNVSTLASTLNVSKSHATSVTDRLVEKELITRERSTSDRRVIVLALTDKGSEVLTHLEGIREKYMQKRFEPLSKEDLKELIRIYSLLSSEEE
ncbi:MarR family transcriptional regulator [Pontibacillus yanchengensis]|uniref:MarR family transcriptional regulator n=2 Tax=Pontibacillus yanchengensis TaxID=462910 RepID=A0ACC7VHR4_9BACI|nr:MarR family transcriptional regulator [Pontibacillus yanchengensis]MYL34509.1 MarR family transcriptional regulator [Pontibacillus yanchengensis]MYL54317.1 MarR family transcriptional regulator [Pontibacillus yanchengensis]